MCGRSSSTRSVSVEDRAGRGGFGEREVGARELEPNLDGQPGNAVVEQRPQAVGARDRRASILLLWPRGVRRVPLATCTIALEE